MQPRMSKDELFLFQSFLRNASCYLEFGTGGSTLLASKVVRKWILSVDSSESWLNKVADACVDNELKPELVYVDIGPVGDWGVPIDPRTKDRWQNYHAAVWQNQKAKSADLCFVDGRFRVSCFAQIVLNCSPNTVVGIHDFASRVNYHCVRDIAREIATADDLSFFLTSAESRSKAEEILSHFSDDPA